MASNPSRRVLGVDPGLTRCGVAVIDGSASSVRLIDHACLRTEADAPLAERLHVLHESLSHLVVTHRPSTVAVEEVLFSVNVQTAMATAQAAGVAMLVGAQAGIDVATYTPTQIKLTVAGDGAAGKHAVGRMVAAQLGLGARLRPADVADAVAVALTHLAHGRLAAAAADSPAAGALADATREARRAGRGGWERVLADRAVRSGTSAGGRR